MTIPQLLAVLDASERLRIESVISMSDAVYAGVAPTVAKEGQKISEKWRRSLQRMLE